MSGPRLAALLVDLGGVLTDLGADLGVGSVEPPVLTAVRAARAAGVRTVLVSNGDSMPAGLADAFDAAVLSGVLGVAKPDERIYLVAAETVGVPPAGCVFVDDLAVNVRAAVAAGMVGVHHLDPWTTVAELEILLGVALRGPADQLEAEDGCGAGHVE